jgi:hypothetical protein
LQNPSISGKISVCIFIYIWSFAHPQKQVQDTCKQIGRG